MFKLLRKVYLFFITEEAMNYRIISRILAIAIVLGILFISLDFIIPIYFPPSAKVVGNHVYLGEIYDGKSLEVNSISFKVSISKALFKSDYVTYSVFSTWDSNGSYDQIGISTIDGEAYATYSYTVLKNNTINYRFNPRWIPLRAGTYNVFMNVSHGFVSFVFNGETLLARTGGNYLVISKYFRLHNSNYAGTTIYEEIYNFKWKLDPVNFNFTDVMGNSQPINYWTLFLHNLTENYSSYVFQFLNTINIYDTIPYFLKGYPVDSLNNFILNIADFNLRLYGGNEFSLYLVPGNYSYEILYTNGLIFKQGYLNMDENIWFNLTF